MTTAFRRLTHSNGVALGLVLGAVFGTWNLVFTYVAPLSDDSLLAVASFYGPMFAVWLFAGFAACRRSGRLTEAVKVGATVAFFTFLVFDLANIVRVNVFLETIRERSDWQQMVANYRTSGFQSLRSHINYSYLMDAPFKGLVSTMIGSGFGLVGGLAASAYRAVRPMSHP